MLPKIPGPSCTDRGCGRGTRQHAADANKQQRRDRCQLPTAGIWPARCFFILAVTFAQTGCIMVCCCGWFCWLKPLNHAHSQCLIDLPMCCTACQLSCACRSCHGIMPTFFVRVTTSPTVKPAVSSYTCNECRNHKYEPRSQLAASSHILVAAVCTRMVSAARLSHQQALRGSHPCMLPADKPQRAALLAPTAVCRAFRQLGCSMLLAATTHCLGWLLL
jgi:hypothetical protein